MHDFRLISQFDSYYIILHNIIETRDSRDRLYILQSDVGARPFDSTGTCAGYPSTNPTLITACDVNKISGSPCTASDALLILQCDVGGANALCPTNRDDYSIYIPDF